MSTEVTHDITPPPAPAHRCVNAACGCNDLVSAGGCSEWCMGNTTEAKDLEGDPAAIACDCSHPTCLAHSGGEATAERGMA